MINIVPLILSISFVLIHAAPPAASMPKQNLPCHSEVAEGSTVKKSSNFLDACGGSRCVGGMYQKLHSCRWRGPMEAIYAAAEGSAAVKALAEPMSDWKGGGLKPS